MIQCYLPCLFTFSFLFLESSDNILLDCFHGLLVVLVSLLGFISLVWLKEQLGHGLGPHWLEEDRREVNRVVMREAQERVNLLRRHLEAAGVRARERHIVPDRVAVATELSKLHKLFYIQSNKLTDILCSKFVFDFDELLRKELKLIHSLYGSTVGCNDILRSARRKKYKRLQEYSRENNMMVSAILHKIWLTTRLYTQAQICYFFIDKPHSIAYSRYKQGCFTLVLRLLTVILKKL